MLRAYRLRKVHARFLESCRNLKEGRAFWEQTPGPRRWLLQLLAPAPLLGLHEDGRRLLAALEWLEANCRTRPLSETVIRHYHQQVYAGQSRKPGEYRIHDLLMVDSPLRRRPAARIVPGMKALDARLAQTQERLDREGPGEPEALLKIAVELHHDLGVLHPFEDANGRVARLSMNHLLRRYGMGYVVYPPLSESDEVWEALLSANRGNLEPLLGCAKKFLTPI